MKEWSDDELDKLFKKSAEELDPPYEPADWQDLRRRLDEADGITPGGWLKKTLPWLALGLLLLMGGLRVYYGIGDNEGKREPSVSGTRPADQSVTEPPSKPGSKAPVAPKTAVSETNRQDQEAAESTFEQPSTNSTGAARALPEVADPDDLKELPRNLASVSGVRKQPNRSEQERGEGAILLPESNPNLPLEKTSRRDSWVELSLSGTTERKQNASQGALADTPQPKKGQNVETRTFETPESQNESTFRNNLLAVVLLDSRRTYRKDERPAYPVVAYTPASDSVGAANSESPEIRIPKWSIRLGVSPDLSAVRMSDMMHPERPGPAASLLVERSIDDQWTLQTGIVRSLKNYSAPFSDYHPDKHLYQTKLPVSVDGTCTVFEVPLNVRFDFSQKQKTRWFLGAGVSSYKMQKEKYTYNYDTYVRNASKGWRGSTGWYLLSHANASAGYERRLSERLSLVAEPYIRIPLRGVGYGKVNLFTGGVWFSLRYSPVFRK